MFIRFAATVFQITTTIVTYLFQILNKTICCKLETTLSFAISVFLLIYIFVSLIVLIITVTVNVAAVL